MFLRVSVATKRKQSEALTSDEWKRIFRWRRTTTPRNLHPLPLLQTTRYYRYGCHTLVQQRRSNPLATAQSHLRNAMESNAYTCWRTKQLQQVRTPLLVDVEPFGAWAQELPAEQGVPALPEKVPHQQCVACTSTAATAEGACPKPRFLCLNQVIFTFCTVAPCQYTAAWAPTSAPQGDQEWHSQTGYAINCIANWRLLLS